MGRMTGLWENNKREDRSGRRAGFGAKDGEGYYLSDSGCKMATEFLGKQSLCLECPFEVCKLDSNLTRSNAK